MQHEKKFNKQAIGVVALALVAFGMLAAGCTPATAAAPTAGGNQAVNTISVTGTGEATASPDIAYVQLGVSVQASDLSQAMEDSNSTMDGIRTALAALDVAAEDIQTSNFNVWLEDIRSSEGAPTGQQIYHVDNTVRVTVRNLDSASDVIGAALDAGANAVHGLSFGIEDTAALEEEARLAAIADARARAEALAGGFNVRVGDPVVINEGSGGAVPMLERAVMADAAGMGGGPSISEGQLTVSMQVSVAFELLP